MANELLRICHVAVADLWAGAEVQLKVLLSKLVQKQELNLTVILLNGGRLEKEVRDLGISVRVFPENLWGSARIFLELVREFRQSNVQLVHTHKYKDTILAAPAARICGVSHIVRTVHGLREPFEGLKAFKMNLYEAVERTVHRYCVDSIIGVSSQIESKYKAEGRVSRVTCIRNGIDLEGKSVQTDRWRTRRDLGIDIRTCLIGTVGRLTPVKGIPYLLEAARILLRQGANVKVLVVGDGSIRQDLMTQTHELGITENVVFLGHREDTVELMQSMDIFVLPSLSEGIPMALLEAMMSSLPVIASRVGGIPEVIEDNISGLLVNPEDPEHLAKMCRRVMEDHELADLLGRAARERVAKEFSSAIMADKVSQVYHKLTSN